MVEASLDDANGSWNTLIKSTYYTIELGFKTSSEEGYNHTKDLWGYRDQDMPKWTEALNPWWRSLIGKLQEVVALAVDSFSPKLEWSWKIVDGCFLDLLCI